MLPRCCVLKRVQAAALALAVCVSGCCAWGRWSLTEAEAVRIACVFVRHDSADSRLDASELRRLTDELGQPLSDAEAKVAMGFLDEDGNGVFNEFVAWAGTRRIKPPAQPKQQ